MKVNCFAPGPGFIVVRKEQTQSRSEAGLEVEENSDDFLTFAQVVVTSDEKEFPTGAFVVFHALDAQSFRDGSVTYNLVDVLDIVGTYAPN